MGVIPFCLVLSCGFAVRYPFPEIRDEVPEKFLNAGILFHRGLPAFAIELPSLRKASAKHDGVADSA
jgi:hypothetical protein